MSAAVATIRTWGEMIKFSHSLFALPWALLATFLAARPATPSGSQLGLIVLCMVAARSAAMTFNRLVDAQYDAANPRTAMRAIPAGAITPATAWLFFLAACALFVVGCVGFWRLLGNPWPLMLALPTLALICGYSYTKRFTPWSHLVLGVAIAFAPVAAWIAINPVTLSVTAWLMLGAVATWIAGFDLIYACQDAEFDRRAGLQSVPARYGVAAALYLARSLHTVTAALLIAVGWTAGLGTLYYFGAACAALLLLVENAIVTPRDLSRVNLAFFTINGVMGLVLAGCGIADVLT